MFNGSNAMTNLSNMTDKEVKQRLQEFEFSPEALHFLTQCLKINPSKRKNVPELLKTK